jgi:GTP-binding protein Era
VTDDIPLGQESLVASSDANIESDKIENSPADQRFMRVALVGAPNAGKSTLINSLCGFKATIVSRKSQTTQRAVPVVLTKVCCFAYVCSR